MQVYRGLDIGTAKPRGAVLERLPHHLIDIRNPDEGYNVGDFVKDADRLIPEIAGRGRLPVVSGGSAFYLRTFVYGLPSTPRSDRETKAALERECAERGLAALRSELEGVDPQTARRLPENDRYRILRALEVYRSTGRPLSRYTLPESPRSTHRLLVVGLERDRGELYRRIDERVEEMMARGLPAEVERLLERGHTFEQPALRAIGYREFAGYVSGEYGLARVQELIQRNSRRYAKRQITFFRRLPGVHWLAAGSYDELRAAVEDFTRPE